MNKEYLYIMDFGNERIYRVRVDLLDPCTDDDIFEMLGLYKDDCTYFYSCRDIQRIEELTL